MNNSSLTLYGRVILCSYILYSFIALGCWYRFVGFPRCVWKHLCTSDSSCPIARHGHELLNILFAVLFRLNFLSRSSLVYARFCCHRDSCLSVYNYIVRLSVFSSFRQWLSFPYRILSSIMAPPQKLLCKCYVTSIVNSVTRSSCGISSHSGSIFLVRCSHPRQTDTLLDYRESATTASLSSPSPNINKDLLDKINDIVNSKLKIIGDDFMIIPSNIEALNNTLQNINAKVKKLESNTKNLEESIMDEIVQRI